MHLVPTHSIKKHRSALVTAVLITALSIITLGGDVQAGDNAGEAGFQFLKMGTSARAEAMGGAYSAIADDAATLHYNPAGLTQVKTRNVTATYHRWVADIQSGYVALALPWGESHSLGIQMQYLDYGMLDGYNASGVVTSNFTPSDLAVAVSAAWRASDQVRLGATGRFITESIEDYDATGLSADVGLLVVLPDGRTRLSLVARNLGSQLSGFTDTHKDDLPATGVAGICHSLRGMPLLFAADLIKPSDDDLGLAFGAEFAGFNSVRLRGGYSTLNSDARDIGTSGSDLAGISGGIGVLAGRSRFDYAFGYLSDLGSQHRVTVSSDF